MSVDLYAPCPCGNGKKIKFCKCKDSVGQMDQVLKMIEGGQLVPAMDRLKSILEEHPDAAWALAIRGRLLLDLREYDSLAENADRFIRLQPSNPLALTQRAAALLFHQDVQGATESLLEALNESGKEVDAFLMDVASIVAMGLAQQGVILSARVYALLSISSQGEGYEADQAGEFLSQLDRSPGVNHLLKQFPEQIERPADADWGERFDEANALLRSNKVLLAQDKFESLRRTAPMQASILSGLLQCAIWRGDLQRQAEMAGQLAQIEALDELTRQRYRALAALLAPEDSISINTRNVRAELDDVDQAEMAFTADDHTDPLPAEQLSRLQPEGSEIRPRSAFVLANRAIGEAAGDPAECPYSLGLLAVFGKQTDRAAEAVVYDVPVDRVETVRAFLAKAVPGGKVELDEPQPLPLHAAFEDRPVRKERPESLAAMTRFSREFAEAHYGTRACELPLPMLGGKSLAATADDASLAFERASAVRVLEGCERIIDLPGALEDVYRLSKVDSLPMLTPSDEEVHDLAAVDLYRVRTEKLSPMQLYILANQARSTGNNSACHRFASNLIDATTSASDDSQRRLAMEGYMLKMTTTADPTAALEESDRAIAFAKQHQLNFSTILLARLEFALSLADQEGFRSTLMEIEQNYGQDPSVMARVQQLLVQLGILRPDGSLRQPAQGAPGAAPAAAPGGDFTPAPPPEQRPGGVWTPDSPETPKPAGEGGGSKIWVPGMD